MRVKVSTFKKMPSFSLKIRTVLYNYLVVGDSTYSSIQLSCCGWQYIQLYIKTLLRVTLCASHFNDLFILQHNCLDIVRMKHLAIVYICYCLWDWYICLIRVANHNIRGPAIQMPRPSGLSVLVTAKYVSETYFTVTCAYAPFYCACPQFVWYSDNIRPRKFLSRNFSIPGQFL